MRATKDKVISALSLARRAGKLAVGFDAVEQAVKTKRAALVVMAEGLSERTKRNVLRICDENGARAMLLPVTMDDIENRGMKRFGVGAITDGELANLTVSAAKEADLC